MWAAQRKEHRFAAETFLLLLETESAEVLQVYFFLSARGKRLFLASLLGLQVAGFSLSPSVCVCAQDSSSCKHTHYLGFDYGGRGHEAGTNGY